MSADPAENTEVEASPASEQEHTVRHLQPVQDGESAEVEPVESTEPVEGDNEDQDDEPTGEAGRLRAAYAWAVTTFTPESGLYTERQPSIEETLRRAKHGQQLPDSGPLRAASKAYGYGAAAAIAALDTARWIVAHPARLAVLGVLLTLATLFPATREVMSILLAPFVWAQQALG